MTEDVLEELRNDGTLEMPLALVQSLCGLAERDDRLMFDIQLNLKLIGEIRLAADWYQGEPDAAMPSVMVSVLLHPGADDGKTFRRCMLSMARLVSQPMPTDTKLFGIARQLSLCVSHELARLADLPELAADFAAQRDRFQVLENAGMRMGNIPWLHDQYMACAMACVDARMAVSKAFCRREYEIQRRGESPFVQRTEVALDGIGTNVGKVMRRGKVAPASAATQRWVYDKVTYCLNHPEACGVDVKGRRVCVRDTWSMCAREAKERGIADEKAFATVYNSYRDALHRAAAKGTDKEASPPPEDVVREVVGTHPGLRVPAIAEVLGMNVRQIERALAVLRESGEVVFKGSRSAGGYQLARTSEGPSQGAKGPSQGLSRGVKGPSQGPSQRAKGLSQGAKGPSQGEKGLSQGPSQGGKGLSRQWVLSCCVTPRSAREIMEAAGRTNLTKFRAAVLVPLLATGELELTIPDKPNSRLQKYRSRAGV